MVGKRIRRVSRGYHYFFVKPTGNSSVHRTAEKLIAIRPVREVSIIEGEYGFIVKANELHEDEQNIISRISKAAKGKSTTAVCHCQYVKVNE